MTPQEAICAAEAMNPDQFSCCEKLGWLSDLDGQIRIDILEGLDGCPEGEFKPYSQEDAEERQLLAPAPYAGELYPAYIMMRGAFYNNESTRYENAMGVYNNALASFQAWWTRIHRPVQRHDWRI